MKKKRSFKLNLEAFILIFLLIVSSIFLSFSGGTFILDFKEIGFSVSSQTEKAVYSVSSFFGESVSAVRELWSLTAKYQELTDKLKEYELLERTNAEIKRENKELKELLKFSHSVQIKNIPAEIIGYDPNQMYSGMIINQGFADGIKKNMPVIAFQNGNMALVGKIVQVGRKTAMIIPIYDYRAYIAAKMDLKKHRGLINGQGAEEIPLVMKLIKKPSLTQIKVGDKVVTSGFDDESIFPKNIPIGFVSKIKVYDNQNSMDLFIDPIIDFSCLEYVFVLDTTNSPREN